MHFIGIDIGSTSSKVAVMDECGEFCELFLLPSGFSAVKVARQIKQALEQKGYGDAARLKVMMQRGLEAGGAARVRLRTAEY